MATQIAALAFCALLGGLGLFQLALAAGAPFGRLAWGGAHVRLPTTLRLGSLAALAIYAGLAVIILERAGLIRILPDPSVSEIGAWIVVGYLALGVAMNAISRSTPERLTMTPLALLLCLLSLGVCLGAAPKG
jgi:hypothetical protein